MRSLNSFAVRVDVEKKTELVCTCCERRYEVENVSFYTFLWEDVLATRRSIDDPIRAKRFEDLDPGDFTFLDQVVKSMQDHLFSYRYDGVDGSMHLIKLNCMENPNPAWVKDEKKKHDHGDRYNFEYAHNDKGDILYVDTYPNGCPKPIKILTREEAYMQWGART
jgi:hypothetical protein